MQTGTMRSAIRKNMDQENSLRSEVTLRDVLDGIHFLTTLGLVCDKCGYRKAEWQHQFHRRCTACKATHGDYNNMKEVNEFQQSVFDSITQWVAVLEARRVGRSAGNDEAGKGKAGTP